MTIYCFMRQKNYKMWESGPVLAEQQRRLKEYKNNVDIEKISDNVHLAGIYSRGSLPEFITKYKEDNGIGGRFNVDINKHKKNGTNVLCQSIFSASSTFFSDLSKDEITEYFAYCLSFIVETYPECPIISADIHFDETTPHLHVSWMPIYSDPDTSKKSFNQKKLQLGKDYMSNLQQSFYMYMKSKGYQFEEYKEGYNYLDLDAYKKKIEAEKEIFKDEPIKTLEYREQLLSKNTVSVAKTDLEKANTDLQRINTLIHENEVLKIENTQLKAEKDRLKDYQKRYYELLEKTKQLEKDILALYKAIKELDMVKAVSEVLKKVVKHEKKVR